MTKRRKLLKKLKKSTAVKEAMELDYNKDGSAIINVGLIEAEDIFSPFAYKTYELLDCDVVEYINTYEKSIPLGDDLSIDVYTEEATDQDMKKRIRTGIKRHYAEDLVIVNKEIKSRTLTGIIYSIIGVLILLLGVFLSFKFNNLYFDTIVSVIGWLFLWDGFEIILLERRELRRLQLRDYRLLNAKIHVRRYSQKIQREFGIGDFEEEEE